MSLDGPSVAPRQTDACRLVIEQTRFATARAVEPMQMARGISYLLSLAGNIIVKLM
jgi:hypothetical protein